MQVVDLTHTLDASFPSWDGPDANGLTVSQSAELSQDGFNTRRWDIDEHIGTHIDAPWHFDANGMTAEEIDVADLVGPAVVIDISARAKADPDVCVTSDDLEHWEDAHGPIPRGAIVLMNSGWRSRLCDTNGDTNGDPTRDSNRYCNVDAQGRFRFPGFSEEAALWLLSLGRVVGIGTDTLSLDQGRSTSFPVHHRWLGSGRWGLENVTNLDTIPQSGALVSVGFPKVAGASGAPCRVVAMLFESFP